MSVTGRRVRVGLALVLLALTDAAIGRGGETPAADPGPLGETPAQIAQRYGPVRRHNARVRHHQVLEGGSAMDGDLYERNGMIIRVVYQRGQAVLLEFNRPAGPLLPADVDLLLASTAGSFAWAPSKDSTGTTKLYRRTDNRAVASCTLDADGSLLVATEDANVFDDELLP